MMVMVTNRDGDGGDGDGGDEGGGNDDDEGHVMVNDIF